MSQAIKTAARAAESRFRKKEEDQKLETAGMMRWLLTYADMITLMLALFIILFSMSTISRVKVQNFARSVSGGFDNVWSVNQPPDGGTQGSQMFSSSSNIPAIQKDLDQYVAKKNLQSQVQVHMDHRGLVITLLSDKSYYDSGSADLRPQTMTILDNIAKFLKRTDNLIRVEGNTDNVPIHTYQYPTNWELSTARADHVVRYLYEHDKVQPTRLSAAGYGEFHPRTGNISDGDRQQNRRVDIVLLNASISNAEKGQ
ncbi:MAG: OmpA family protein [Candidatus Eremiobacteraeota bacterium]|nr:OmpA family protein [Candidatus Eremiobacteraeota bacterium]